MNSQADFDRALNERVVPVLVGRGFFRIETPVEVHARDWVEVEARGGATIHASGNAIIRAMGRAEVEARDDVEVHAGDGAVVRASGRALVYASEGAEVFLSEHASVIADGAIRLHNPSGTNMVCPICGASVQEWVCTNRVECGHILCPICADGASGGSNSDDKPPCPHFVAAVWHETNEVADGTAAIEAIDFQSPLDPRLVLDDIVGAGEGFALGSTFTGGSMGAGGSWSDYFAPDPSAVATQIEQLAAAFLPLRFLDVYLVAVRPAPVLGMAYPRDIEWGKLKEAGIDHVVGLEPADYESAPVQSHEFPLEDLYPDSVPTNAITEEMRVREAAAVVAECARKGEGVLVHCCGGKGRTGTVLALVLIDLGRSADAAADRVRAHGWPEGNKWQEALVLRSGS